MLSQGNIYKFQWNPETDACECCKECDYFLNEFWNCQGESEPCLEFLPKFGSKKYKVEMTILKEE